MNNKTSFGKLMRRISWRHIALLLAVVVVIFLGTMLISHILEKKDAESVARGVESLQELDTRDVAAIEEKIKKGREERDAALRAENEANAAARHRIQAGCFPENTSPRLGRLVFGFQTC